MIAVFIWSYSVIFGYLGVWEYTLLGVPVRGEHPAWDTKPWIFLPSKVLSRDIILIPENIWPQQQCGWECFSFLLWATSCYYRRSRHRRCFSEGRDWSIYVGETTSEEMMLRHSERTGSPRITVLCQGNRGMTPSLTTCVPHVGF